MPPVTPRFPLVVVGVGADGWAGLTTPTQAALRSAEIVVGSPRQLAYLDDAGAGVTAERVRYPSPLAPLLPSVISEHAERRIALLASGDPMFYGIGSTLARLYGADALQVHTRSSSVSLAAARMGWPLEDVEVINLVGRPVDTLAPSALPGRRAFVLVAGPDGAEQVRALAARLGCPDSRLTVLERLGGPDERIAADHGPHDPLAIVAVEFVSDHTRAALPRTPGLPDEAFDHDGQLTKREIRALVLAALAPVPGQLLWDVGAGSGSVGIEWMRTHPACRAIAVEPRDDRRTRIVSNAAALGVPGLEVVAGAAPEALTGLPTPDAIFVGGGVSVTGVIESCVAVLGAGARLVANAVTVEAETVLAAWHARLGGSLTRIAVQRADPIGGFTAWRPAMPVTQWSYRKDTS